LLQETHKIPIVFVTVGDPIGNGFVGSYPHPGGNVTGFVVYEPAMAGKWLEILKNIVPGLSNAGVAYNPKVALSDFDLYLNALRAAGKRRQVEINVAQYEGETELERVINEFGSRPSAGLVLVPDYFLVNRSTIVVRLAAKYRLPGVYPFAYFAVGGGLVSYGIDPFDSFTKAPAYVDAILRGAKPQDLPIQFPTKFELVINLKTAKTLGLEVPPSLLAVADRLIE
jgi:putative ABC transport system substrate-binding protein